MWRLKQAVLRDFSTHGVHDSQMLEAVSLRPLQADDLPLLFSWLNAPHLKPFYRTGALSFETVKSKYLPRLAAGHPTRCLVAENHEGAFGYLQWYLNRSYPSHGLDLIGEPDGISLDYFIGDPEYLGRHLGTAMLSAAVELIGSNVAQHDRLYFVCHHVDNTSAIRCSEMAGFKYRKRVWEQDEEHLLLVNARHAQTAPADHAPYTNLNK